MLKIDNWKCSENGKKMRWNDNFKLKLKCDNYKIIEIIFISIIVIIVE